MQSKTCLVLLLATIFVGLGGGCSSPSSRSTVLRFGVALPLSGGMAEYGENARDGLTLAKETIERDHKGTQLELVTEDTQDNPAGTVTAVRRLVDVTQVKYIIGGLTSSGVLAAAPYAQQHGVLFFTPAASAPGIPEIGDLVFRNWQSDSLLASMYGGFAYSKLGAKNAAILQVANDYGNTNATQFARTFEAAGGHIVLTRSFPQGTTDFRTLVTQVRALEGVDALLLIGYPDEYRGLFKEIAVQRVSPSIRVLATDTFYSPDLIAQLGASAEGTYCAVAAKPAGDYQPRAAFTAAYRSRFKRPDGSPKDPGLVSDTAHDALHLLFDAVAATDGSPASVSKWLLNVKDYPGAAGPTTFTPTGDLVGGMSVFRATQGKFIPVS